MTAFETNYPNSIDDTSSLPLATDLVTPVKADVVNGLRSALLALEEELGIKPSQTYGTVAAKFLALDLIINQITKTFLLDPDYLTSNLGFKTIVGSGHDMNLIPDGNNVNILGKNLILTGQLFNNANTLIINGLTGISLRSDGSNIDRLVFSTSNITVQPNTTLNTNGSGNINLPNNVNAKFKIEGISVNDTVTSTNLNTLTAGETSEADLLHYHNNNIFIALAGENITKGQPVGIEFDTLLGVTVYQSFSIASTNRKNTIGFAKNNTFASTNVAIATSGIVDIPDAIWESVPSISDIGAVVYLSQFAGKVVVTMPGSNKLKIGVIVNTTLVPNTTKILMQIAELA